MGFWQGLNEGLTYVLDKKAAKESEEQDRAFKTKMYQDQLRSERQGKLFDILVSKGATASTISDSSHEIKVLKQLGASDEVLAEAAGYGGESLQKAIEIVQANKAAVENTPLEFGTAQVDALLSSAVKTAFEGKEPDYNLAASIYGINPEDLDKPVEGAEGMTYRDLVRGALTPQDTQKVTFLNETVGKPLTDDDVSNILSGAKEGLEDSLKAEIVATSRVASNFAAKAEAGTLTEEEIEDRDLNNERMKALAVAEEDLKRGSVTAATQLVGGKAILPFLQTNSAALNYNFGQGWGTSLQELTFNSAEEVEQAVKDFKVFEGDLVIVDGKVRTVRNRARSQ